MRHDPGDRNETIPAEIEQTDEDELAIEIVGARDASLVTETVYVPPTNGDDGGVDWNVKPWTIFSTVIEIESVVA